MVFWPALIWIKVAVSGVSKPPLMMSWALVEWIAAAKAAAKTRNVVFFHIGLLLSLSGVGHMCCCFVCVGVSARTTGRSSDERASVTGGTREIRPLWTREVKESAISSTLILK